MLVDYEFRILKYHGKKDGLLRIGDSRYPKGLWLNPKEFGRDYATYNWVELVVQLGGNWYGFDAYRVRAEPSLESPVLVKLREERLWPNKSHSVKPTGNINGHWAQVSVQLFEGLQPDRAEMENLPPGKPVGDAITGWIKIANDEGVVKDIRLDFN